MSITNDLIKEATTSILLNTALWGLIASIPKSFNKYVFVYKTDLFDISLPIVNSLHCCAIGFTLFLIYQLHSLSLS